MAEPIPTPTPTPQADPPNPAPAPATPPANPADGGAGQHVPYARFKEVNDKLKALQDKEAQQSSAQQTLEQRLAALEGDLTKERAEKQRLQVASAKQLPDDLADRLRGETREELEADADRLLAYLKPKSGPGVPPPSGGGKPPVIDLNSMTPAQIREARKAGKI